MDLIEAQLRLARARGLTAGSLQRLMATMPGDEPRDLLWLCRHSELVRQALLRVDRARVAADRRWVERERIALLDVISAHYPPQLAATRQAPRVLYCRGSVEALSSAQLAIVGSRLPTSPGALLAREFADQLARAGLTITSGLALGIDAAGHQGALSAGGRTIAVLGCGLDTIYPAEHRELATRIASAGSLVSEFPPGTAPRSAHFPRRNRIISGLSRGLLVVEAALGSGSLITAQYATRQGRPVFAIPGSVRNRMVGGCHLLIRAGARLVERPAEILDELQISSAKQMLMPFRQAPAATASRGAPLDKDYEILLDAVGFEPISLDRLVDRTGLASQSVASMLLILELEGVVGRQADGLYMRL